MPKNTIKIQHDLFPEFITVLLRLVVISLSFLWPFFCSSKMANRIFCLFSQIPLANISHLFLTSHWIFFFFFTSFLLNMLHPFICFPILSFVHRCLLQSSSPATASNTTDCSSPPRFLSPAWGAPSLDRPSPGCSHCSGRGGPGWERSDHPDSLCAAHPSTKKLHQPTAATTHGDHRPQGVHFYAATVQWVPLLNACVMTNNVGFLIMDQDWL